MRPYSDDLRRRIVEAIQENVETQAEIAFRFSVSDSFVEKLWHRFGSTGNCQALPHGGGQTRFLKADEKLIREAVKEQPDITLAELTEKVARETGRPAVSLMTMSVELRR